MKLGAELITFANMKIKRLYINNYKSLVDFELLEPNPFSVFVGPNAAGKSNVFEALEFLSYADDFVRMDSLFGGANAYLNKQLQANFRENNNLKLHLDIEVKIDYLTFATRLDFAQNGNLFVPGYMSKDNRETEKAGTATDLLKEGETASQWFNRMFSRLFVQKSDLVKVRLKTPYKLALDAENLPLVLKKILDDEDKMEEILDWMSYLVPGFDSLEIKSDPFSGDAQLYVKEKGTYQFFPQHLLSDGTYNILALLTAVYQSDEPQFLCIEEPENSITPYVQRALVNFFRTACEEKGHYIWLNTHSPTIVNELEPKELILIDKVEGITKAKQLDPNLQFKTMKLDEAWLTNSLGGGLPW